MEIIFQICKMFFGFAILGFMIHQTLKQWKRMHWIYKVISTVILCLMAFMWLIHNINKTKLLWLN